MIAARERITHELPTQGDGFPMPNQYTTPIPTAVRFWTKVDFNGPVPEYRPELGPCWLWTAARNASNYGVFYPQTDVAIMAHRWAYEFCVGPIPEGLEIDHLCRTHNCVYPWHLEPVTHRVNQHRGMSFSGVNSRKTHCDNNHPLSGDNLYIEVGGGRRCIACRQGGRARRLLEATPEARPAAVASG